MIWFCGDKENVFTKTINLQKFYSIFFIGLITIPFNAALEFSIIDVSLRFFVKKF